MWKLIAADTESIEYKKWFDIAEQKNCEPILTTEHLDERQRIFHIKKSLVAIKPLLRNLGKYS